MAGVFLGMPGPWAEDYCEKTDHYTTKIGGLPDWPLMDTNIRKDLLECKLCGGSLSLLAQVYAPISAPKLNVEERIIYIFGCLKQQCGSDSRSWRAFRVQKFCSEKQSSGNSSEEVLSGEDSSPVSTTSSSVSGGFLLNECLKFDDESDSDVDLEDLARALAEASTVASKSKKQTGSRHSTKNLGVEHKVENTAEPVLPCFYIYYEKEQLPSEVGAISAGYSSLSIKTNESTASDLESEEKWEGEAYEYDKAPGADRTYLKFDKRLGAYPHQCLRYSYGGKPLLAANNLVEPGFCSLCGSSRNYELQLMPPLMYFLHQADHGSSCPPDSWCWMTLIVYTCSNSCCSSSCCEKSDSCSWTVAEEVVINQDE